MRYLFVQGDVTQMDLAPDFVGADVGVQLAALTEAEASFDHPEAMKLVKYAAFHALIEPKGIWEKQPRIEEGMVLVIIFDLWFEESDYIRNLDNFLQWWKEDN